MPQAVDRIVHKTLRKNLSDRYQTANELLADLKAVQKRLEFEAELERNAPPDRRRGADPADPAEPSAQVEPRKTSDDMQATRDVPKPAVSSAPAVHEASSSLLRNKGLVSTVIVLLIAVLGTGGYWMFANHSRQIESIAVLPFVNESGNPDVEYLSDGMTETLIGSLSRLPNLSVKARSSVFRYKGKETKAQQIAKELNVQAILSGRVVQHGDQLTLSLELIDAQTENVIWSEQYNRKQADLINLQTEIAHDVSTKLKTKLSGADQAMMAKMYTANPEAYRLYLQGRFYWNKREEKDFLKAVEYYNQAIALDPNYAMAYAGLADSYALLSSFGFMPPAEAIPKARDFAHRAMSLDDTLAGPHTTLAYELLQYDYDLAGAEREFKRAIELNTN